MIRKERPEDASAIRSVIAEAFDGKAYASGDEAGLVDALRTAGALTESLVHEHDGRIDGQVALSPAEIGGRSGWLAVGPVAVAPARQGLGVGAGLMRAAIESGRRLAAHGLVLTGAPKYYGRLGFQSYPELTCAGVGSAYVLALPFGASPPVGDVRFHTAFGAS